MKFTEREKRMFEIRCGKRKPTSIREQLEFKMWIRASGKANSPSWINMFQARYVGECFVKRIKGRIKKRQTSKEKQNE